MSQIAERRSLPISCQRLERDRFRSRPEIGCRGLAAVGGPNIISDDHDELFGDAIALERCGFLSVHEHRRYWNFAGTRQRYAYIRELRLTGTVDDAAHHRDLHRFDTRILRTPCVHRRTQIDLDAAGKLLEIRARCAAATRTCRH